MSDQPESRVQMRATPPLQPPTQQPVEGQQLAAGFGFRKPVSADGQPALGAPWQAALPGHKVDTTTIPQGHTTGQPPPGPPPSSTGQPPPGYPQPAPAQPTPQSTPQAPPPAPPQQAPWPAQHPAQSTGPNGAPQSTAQPTQPADERAGTPMAALLGAPFEDEQLQVFNALANLAATKRISLWQMHETLLTLFGGDR